MGLTREKKVSKRALKTVVNEQVNGKSAAISELEIPKSSHNVAPGIHLAVPQNSRKSSRSSLRSSVSSRDYSSGPVAYKCRVEVRAAEGKGLCLFATQAIPRGALVLAEIPLIRLTREEEEQVGLTEKIIGNKFALLSKSNKKAFGRLHDSEKEGFSEVRSTYHTNCYNLAGHRSKLGGSCLGLRASRINHSCVPNVQFSFLGTIPAEVRSILEAEKADEVEHEIGPGENHGVMLFHAIKRIGKGHEILSNYESAYLVSSQRQVKMRMYYGFDCDCKACNPEDNPFWLKSDERRMEMIRLRGTVRQAERSWQTHSEMDVALFVPQVNESADDSEQCALVTTALQALTRLLDLLELEGLCGVDLFHVCRKLTTWCRRGGEQYREAQEQWRGKMEAVYHTINGAFEDISMPDS